MRDPEIVIYNLTRMELFRIPYGWVDEVRVKPGEILVDLQEEYPTIDSLGRYPPWVEPLRACFFDRARVELEIPGMHSFRGKMFDVEIRLGGTLFGGHPDLPRRLSGRLVVGGDWR